MKKFMLWASALWLCGQPALAQTHSADETLQFFEEEARVITASRREQAASEAPVPVEVITRQEIEAYGNIHLWDLLRFKTGMDVMDGRSNSGNRAIVSVRAMPREFVAELLVLVDGRIAYAPFFSGVLWNLLPVQMQDIDRIEIVRGPNAALYGSNAALGVINIITKKPEGRKGLFSSAYGGTRGTMETANALEAGGKNWGIRGSHTYFAEDGHLKSSGASHANDFWGANKANFRGCWQNDKTQIDIFAGGAWNKYGLPDYAGDPLGHSHEDFEMAKVLHRLDDGNEIEVLFSHDGMGTTARPFYLPDLNTTDYQYDAEFLHRLSWMDKRLDTTYGASYRYAGTYSNETYAGSPKQLHHVTRGYLHQSVKLAKAVTLVAGVSLEDSRTGGMEPAWQASALLSPRESHVFRLSYALAPTIPSLFYKYGNYRPSSSQIMIGNPDLVAEKAHNYEAGYLGKFLNGRLHAEAVLFYTYLKDMPYEHVSGFTFPPLVYQISADNSNRAIVRGAEIRLSGKPCRRLTAFANYSYTSMTVSKPVSPLDQARLDKNSPEHKLNLGATAELGAGFSAASNLGYKDNYQIGSLSRGTLAIVPRSWRADLRLSYKPKPNLEAFIAGQDLFQPYRLEYPDGTAAVRTFYGGLSAKF